MAGRLFSRPTNYPTSFPPPPRFVIVYVYLGDWIFVDWVALRFHLLSKVSVLGKKVEELSWREEEPQEKIGVCTANVASVSGGGNRRRVLGEGY